MRCRLIPLCKPRQSDKEANHISKNNVIFDFLFVCVVFFFSNLIFSDYFILFIFQFVGYYCEKKWRVWILDGVDCGY